MVEFAEHAIVKMGMYVNAFGMCWSSHYQRVHAFRLQIFVVSAESKMFEQF